MNDEEHNTDDSSKRSEYIDLFNNYKTELLVIGSSLLAALILDFIDIPQAWVNAAYYALAGFVLVFIFGDAILDKIHMEDNNLLVSHGLDKVGVPPSVWNIGSERLNRMKTEGEPLVEGGIYFVEDYDPDENTAEGTWFSELSTVQQLRYRSALKRAKEEMQYQALEGIAAEETAKASAIQAQKELLDTFVSNLVEKSTLDGADINAVIEDTIDAAKLSDIADEVANDAAANPDPSAFEFDESDIDDILEDATEIENEVNQE